MEYLDNMAARQNLLQVARETVIERIDSHHIEHVAVLLEAQLNESDRLALDKPLTVEAEYGWWIAC